MSYAHSVDQLSIQQLVTGCQHTRPDNTHEPFCFELFRRAIAHQSDQCWAALYGQYQKLVGHWLLEFSKSSQPPGNQMLEELVASTFAAFWRAFTAEKLQQAEGLGSILTYLKSCAATAVLQIRRKAARTVSTVAWEQLELETHSIPSSRASNPEQQVLTTVHAQHLWAIVDSVCSDERERILARLSFVSDLKPVAILELHPQLFSGVEEIYTIRRNLKNRLLRNEALRQMTPT
jgi:DNA-directed RNA polymerase specialized sigma24 family protein